MRTKTYTKGDVIVEEIKIGDIHYEYGYNFVIISKVISKPKLNEGLWSWTSKNMLTGKVINYSVNVEFSGMCLNIYNNKTYMGCTQI